MSQTADFGFKTVPVTEKTTMVKGVFESVAGKYDVMNDLMSLGTHRIWKRDFIGQANPKPHEKILDVAGGTGDITKLILRHTNFMADVTLADINTEMLAEAQKRIIDENWPKKPSINCLNAESLPFDDNTFDLYAIAFGIRNVTDKPKALKEALRVLKRGGRFFCLEFSKVNIDLLERVYNFYSFNIIPKVGQLVAKDGDSYQYLVESIKLFPDAPDFANMIKEAGFGSVKYRRLSGGIVAIHSGWKL